MHKKEILEIRNSAHERTVCESLLISFASIKIEIEYCEINDNESRQFVHKNNDEFISAFKHFLIHKVKDILRVGNDVISKHYMTEFKSAITISVYVRNTCPLKPEVTYEKS